jgi:hypothetical protein
LLNDIDIASVPVETITTILTFVLQHVLTMKLVVALSNI